MSKGYEVRLEHARVFAMEWARTLPDSNYKLPDGFRIPKIYSSNTYVDHQFFLELNNNYKLTPDMLEMAKFVHRGLYYQSLIYEDDNMSYLPHAYRAFLLENEDLKALSQFCYITPDISPISGKRIMKDVNGIFVKNLDEACNLSHLPKNLVLGGAFYQPDNSDPLAILEKVFDFRETTQGTKLRINFEELLSIGRSGNKSAVEDRLSDINLEMVTSRLQLFGTVKYEEPSLQMIKKQLEFPGATYLKYLIDRYFPRRYKETLISYFNYPIHETGFQVLFRMYIQNRR